MGAWCCRSSRSPLVTLESVGGQGTLWTMTCGRLAGVAVSRWRLEPQGLWSAWCFVGLSWGDSQTRANVGRAAMTSTLML